MKRFRHLCFSALEPLLLVAVVFAPWAFGCAHVWSERTLTVVGCLLGMLALMARSPQADSQSKGRPWHLAFGATWLVFLAYILVGAANQRATAVVTGNGVFLEYRDFVSWLPHSYDGPRSWLALAKNLAVAGMFLALWKLATPWFQTDPRDEEQDWPKWFSRLIWVLSVSSALLAVVSIAQRMSGTNRLLFLVPRMLPGGGIDARSSFGPYPYQSNAAQYFNLIWPLTLGYWWSQHQRIWERTGVRPRYGSSALTLLPFFTALMIACPFLSNSRGGAVICMLQIAGALAVLVLRSRNMPRHVRYGVVGGVSLALMIAAASGWEHLWDKFEKIDDGLSGRKEIYVQARRMLAEFQPWGSGADTFKRLSDLYTDPEARHWQAYVHDDWLETLLSYGTVGCSILGILAVLWVIAWLKGPWLRIPRLFSAFAIFALMGMAAHAKYDLPFQILSLQALFGVVSAVALVSPPPWAKRGKRREGADRDRWQSARWHEASGLGTESPDSPGADRGALGSEEAAGDSPRRHSDGVGVVPPPAPSESRPVRRRRRISGHRHRPGGNPGEDPRS